MAAYHQTYYAIRFKFFIFNTQNVFTGWRIVNAEIALDQSGDSYEGSGISGDL